VESALAACLLTSACGADTGPAPVREQPSKPWTHGAAQSPASTAGPQDGVRFPLSASPNRRYLVDAAGRPFGLRGRAAWYLPATSVTAQATFLDDTIAKGFNAIEINALMHDPQANNPPFAGNGSLPFARRLDGGHWDGALRYAAIGSEAPDFATPNETYWSHLDALLDACESRDIVVLLFPAYVGYEGEEQGWMREMVANGRSRMQAYGAWIASRYKNRRNLVWMLGGDDGAYPGGQRVTQQGLIDGLRSVGGQASTLYSAEWASEMVGTDQADFGRYVNFNGVYSWTGKTASLGLRAYNRTPVQPAFLLEEPYDEEGPGEMNYNPHATQPVRRFVYWGWLGTVGGYVAGNGHVWRFNPGWEGHLDTPGANDLKRLNDFIRSIEWWRLKPAGTHDMGAIVMAGGGRIDKDDYVAAAATSEGDLLVAYIGPTHIGGVKIDMTRMRGPALARWFDPASGRYVAIGTYPNTGTRNFLPPDGVRKGDWVLRLDLRGRNP